VIVEILDCHENQKEKSRDEKRDKGKELKLAL